MVITIRLPVVKQAVSEYDNNASNLNSNDLEDNILNKIPVDINITRQWSEHYIYLEQDQHRPKWERVGFDSVISAPLINKSNVSVLLKLLIPIQM